MKRINRPAFGILGKVAAAFILVGLLPLLCISTFFLEKFTDNVNDIVLNDAGVILKSASGYVDTMLKEWEEGTVGIYTKNLEPGLYLGDVLADDTISEQQKNRYIRKFLAGYESMNGLKSIRFLDRSGTVYYTSEAVGKVANTDEMNRWAKQEQENQAISHQMTLEAVHKDLYFSNINDKVITIKRNLFDVTSVVTVDNYLGTIYLDISEDVIGQQLSRLNLGSRSGFYIIDKNGEEIYKSENQVPIQKMGKQILLEAGNGQGHLIEDEDSYYMIQKNRSGGWVSILRVHKGDILENVEQTRQYILITLLLSSVFLLFLYFLMSKRISIPIRNLKNGMEKIQKGNLAVRVPVTSRDEVGVLAEGLNQMASQLEEYIDRVYVAEIKQREAELNALKSQIRPHYLYNTLDVIRMTAVKNDDSQAAEMIESLARQLRYLIGEKNDSVSLERELDNIRDYFKLIRIKFENRLEIKISVSDKLKTVRVPKLVLQPVVENSVKHGLRQKEGNGNVWITANLQKEILVLTVMDDGCGMEPDTLARLQEKLVAGADKRETLENGGIGLLNVQERIWKKYGEPYGLEIQSTLGMGTIVMIKVPYRKEVQDDECSFD